MRAHVREQFTLDELARAAGMIGPDRLLQLFRPTGESPCKAFKRIKMEQAARLLTQAPEMSVKEAALNMGYKGESLAQFYRDFAEFHGVPPRRYREAASGGAAERPAASTSSGNSSARNSDFGD